MITILGIVVMFCSGYAIYKLTKGKAKSPQKLLKPMLYILLVLGALTTVIGVTFSGNSDSDSSPKQKSTKKVYDKNSVKELKQYINHNQDNNSVKKIYLKNDTLVIQTQGLTFNGKTMGYLGLDTIVRTLNIARTSSLAKNGIVIAQNDKYTDSTGHDKTMASFSIYYSKNQLDSIDFKNYESLINNDPNTLLDNADGYDISSYFSHGKNYLLKDSEQFKTNDIADSIYSDLSN